MYEAEFKRIIAASKNNSLTFFVGAGVSALSNAPTWSELINELCRKMGREPKESYSSDEYLQIPQMFFYSINENENEYYDFIEKYFSASALLPNILHKEMMGFNPNSFITTNFDELLEDAAIQHCQSFKSIACDREVPNINGDRFILKVHGDIRHRNIVFKEEDYLSYSENFKLIETLLKSIFSTNTVVFIGYGLNDYNIKLILNWVKTLLKDNFCKPIFIYTDDISLTTEDLLYQESKGLHVIEYEKVGPRFDEYLPRYLSIIDAIKRSAALTYEGKTTYEAFEVTYELLSPLDQLDALRISDITDKLSNEVIINCDGTIVSPGSLALQLFFEVNSLTQEQYDALPESIKDKYHLISRVFSKARIRMVKSNHRQHSSIDLCDVTPLGDLLCISFNYKEMFLFTQKEYKTLRNNFQKAFYLARIKKYDEAFFLFTQIANEAFKSKDYLLYYLAEVNRIKLYRILEHTNRWYRCYDFDKISTFSPSDDIEKIFRKLPLEFQMQYDTLRDLHSVNLLYEYSYEAFLDGEKLRKAIETQSWELGLTSSDKVIARINESLHFFLGNHLVVDEFAEYKNTINHLMSLLIYKYSTQNEKILHEQMFLDIGHSKVAFDELDFYCLIEFFTADELVRLFTKNGITTIEFQNLDTVEKAVCNILDYYEMALKRPSNNVDILHLQRQIRICLTILRYVEISQPLVDKLCIFIFKYDFREIQINDKVFFLHYQLGKRYRYSSTTAKVIENRLFKYIDTHIDALIDEKPFDVFSSNTSIGYCDLIRYISSEDVPYHSRRLSIRVSKIISHNLSTMFPHIVHYYWAYISTYQRHQVIVWAKAKLIESFSFDFFTLLVECDAKIGDEIISSLKEYLRVSIENDLSTAKNSKAVSYPRKNPYDELNQVGYWCLTKTLPSRFDEFVGYDDTFDFYYLYKQFDYNKFNPAWLLNLYPHVLEWISKDETVREKIRVSIATTLHNEKLVMQDRNKLVNILTRYFCQ